MFNIIMYKYIIFLFFLTAVLFGIFFSCANMYIMCNFIIQLFYYYYDLLSLLFYYIFLSNLNEFKTRHIRF